MLSKRAICCAILMVYSVCGGAAQKEARKEARRAPQKTETIACRLGTEDRHARIAVVLEDMKKRFAGTTYAQQAGLLAAKTLYEKGNPQGSRAELEWVAQNAIDPGYKAIAKLRLAAELLDAKSYDDALKQLAGDVPKEFEPLVADRKGDIYMAQGKRDEAQTEYRKAWTGLGATSDYRRLIEIKLNAVGVDPKSLAPAITVTPAAPKTS